MQAPICVLSEDGQQLIVNGKPAPSNVHVRPKPGGRFYVSFYYDFYRHWANWVTPGVEITAHRTHKYRISTGGSGNRAQQIHMDKARRSAVRNAMRNGKSMY